MENKLNQIQRKKDEKIKKLTTEKETLQNDLADLSEQNANLQQEKAKLFTQKHQIKQDLTIAKETINQLAQELTNEKSQRTIAENNLAQKKQDINDLSRQLQTEREASGNLTQNHTNLINAYQQAIKDKETTQKQLNQFTKEIKTFAKTLAQWQKVNHYQQLEKQNEFQAQITQPPPWKPPK